MIQLLATVGLVFTLVFVPVSRAGEPAFQEYWHDGKAELNGYRLTTMRYGQPRTGQAVLIYVTEPFSESKRVKVDDPAVNPGDVVEAFKLNLVRDFQTGIYDYNTMVSVFLRGADFTPLKISFSSQEWCGHVYAELVFRPNKVTGHHDSYFEGETGPQYLNHPRGGIAEDALFIVLRGLRGEFLEPGQSKSVPFLPGVFYGRLAHRPPTWITAVISRAAGPEILYTVKTADGREGKFFIEQEYPHRIRRWELLPDVAAELTGSARLEYWKLQGNGDEKFLKEIGLE